MKTYAALLLAAVAAGCTANAGAPVEMSAAARTQLAEELRGRVAGPPQSCVQQRRVRGNRSVGEGAIIFETQGRGLIYVNRPPGGCPELNFSRALIIRTPSTNLCSGDIATVADLSSGITYGSCGLGEFTPYRLAR